MPEQTRFDLSRITPKSRQFEDLLLRVEEFQKSRPEPQYNNTGRAEETPFEGRNRFETVGQDE
jgi:hypothetical protein